ncbi:regulatory protein RecX [Psychromonas sp. RZ22]|uniref:regulatory protein RecX n=1 Tax=Psychromonas algarum TaxID=2555643 RepID=UPI001067E6C7|nr:regulatory protein RecX [Psychromonas sp. RZ22]TEW55957.1 regulatory protein RecX [Psychromonas sp. RZ22]
MFTNKPIKIAKDIEGVRRSALWHLSRRDHSQAELLTKLKRKTDNHDWIEVIINECLDFNYLNDQRFTESFIRSSQNKGYGKTRIKQDLKLKGISEPLIKMNIDDNDFDYINSAEQLLNSKYQEAIVTQHLKQKAMAFLQAKGHSFDIITLAIESHNEHYPTPKFDNTEQACLLLSKKFRNSIDDKKQTNKAIRYLTSHGYDYSKSNQAIKLFNQNITLEDE